MERPLRQMSFTDWMPHVNVLDNSAHENLIMALDYAWHKYELQCCAFYEYLKDKHFLSSSEEDQFKLKVAAAILTIRSELSSARTVVPVNAESVLCLNVVIDRYIPGINPISQAERSLGIVASIADILTAEINLESLATSDELVEDEDDPVEVNDVFDDESNPDYEGKIDFDEEMVTPEFAKILLEFSSQRSLSGLARAFISFSEEVSQFRQPFFGVIYSWRSENPLLELADTIKLQQELAWIQEQRVNLIQAFAALENDPTDPELLDNLAAHADDLLEKLTIWLTELTGLSEDMWYQILNQMSEFDSMEVNYYNLFLHIGMEACRYEPGDSRPDFLLGQVVNLGGLDPNGYPADMLIKKYPVVNK